MTRPVMGRDELRRYHVRSWGRDYSESDDGYSDMEAENRRGWAELAGWGADGWDLGQWPYVMIYRRNQPGKVEVFGLDRSAGQTFTKPATDFHDFVARLRADDRDFFEVTQFPQFEVLVICEGDRDHYQFPTAEDRDAAIDYLFLWHAIGKEWAEGDRFPIDTSWDEASSTYPARVALDAGTLTVPDELRGPYRVQHNPVEATDA